MGVEQSNSSVVLDERLVLKLYRRLEPGTNPELELLRFLTEHGFENIATLEGWASSRAGRWTRHSRSCSGSSARAGDGWELALETSLGRPGWLPARAAGSAR